MLVSVRSVTGQTLAVHNVDESGAVLDLKRSIEHQHNVPSHLQRIIYAGRELDDNATLAASGIVDSTLVQLVVRPDRPVSDEAFARMMQEHEIEQAAHDPNGQPVRRPLQHIPLVNVHPCAGGCAVHVGADPGDATAERGCVVAHVDNLGGTKHAPCATAASDAQRRTTI
ncbi:hypothetical protein PBRA_000596 [Plasmodiophora brassicae]|uniref:Ubiquitin-like domain-containing protein n=1 Tax=Plasmodiophora brassicae TaxID=37360 RepID=A0A0G4IQ23_PLABS|nr:hypothetical protein PBRA_000596 [Plasmodiophora brassicae]